MDALPDARSDAVTTALRNAENKPQLPNPFAIAQSKHG